MAIGFGDGYVLDVDSYELRHRGQVVSVEPQVFDVLAYLLDRRERVVTKEELLDNIWGDRFVSESALTSRLKSARRAVGDDGRTQGVIKTIHGRGYRFVADVDDPAEAASADASVARPAAVPASDGHGRAADHDWPLLGRRAELEQISQLYTTPDAGGVLITGPSGVGKTRLSTELYDLASAGGVPTARARGHAEAAEVSLGALAHLLHGDIFSAGGLDGEFSRGVLLQRAMDAIEARSVDDRLMLFVDDVHLLDEFSVAVLSAVILNGRVFAVMTQRTDPMTEPALAHLTKDGPVTRLDLEPLEIETLDVLLYRVLRAPIGPRALDHLLHTSGGLPGVCRQLVEASIETGALTFEDGVWRQRGDLTAPPSLSALVEQRLAGLDPEHRAAAELLALAGSLDLDVAAELTSEEVLDALDLRGMLDVTDVEGRAEVSLAHPLFGEVLRSQMGRLRGRRVREQLARAMPADAARPDDRLRLARWIIDTEGELDPALALETARLALMRRDEPTARRLVEWLAAERPSARVTRLQAELAFRVGQTDEVERLLSDVDLGAFDDVDRAQVIRRRVTNLFFGTWEWQRAIELLHRLMPQVTGPPLATLESHSVTLRVLGGSIPEAVADAERLIEEATGPVRLELLRALAFGLFCQGRHREVLERCEECRSLSKQLPPSLARPGVALADYAELMSLVELGEMTQARRMIDGVHPGSPGLGWLPMGQARVAMQEGRPQQVRDRLLNPLGLADALGFDSMAGWMRAYLAEAALLEGNEAEAVEYMNRVLPLIGDEPGLPHLDMAWSAAEVQYALGDRASSGTSLLEAAAACADLGAPAVAFAMLHTAAGMGYAPDALAAVEDLGYDPEGVGGRARLTEIRARAAGDPAGLAEAADALEATGLRVLAAKANLGLAELFDDVDAEAAGAARKKARELATVDGIELRIG